MLPLMAQPGFGGCATPVLAPEEHTRHSAVSCGAEPPGGPQTDVHASSEQVGSCTCKVVPGLRV